MAEIDRYTLCWTLKSLYRLGASTNKFVTTRKVEVTVRSGGVRQHVIVVVFVSFFVVVFPLPFFSRCFSFLLNTITYTVFYVLGRSCGVVRMKKTRQRDGVVVLECSVQ